MLKRVLDISLSVMALTVFFPFGIFIALVLKFTGEGEVFYVQQRVGQRGELFGLIKFATMLKESPNMDGGDITLHRDPRVLPFGKILRKTKLNEVPQVVNILKGDMSIVGPRPQTPRYFKLFSDSVQKRIIHLKPGLTGVGSIVFRDEEKLAGNCGMEQTHFHKCFIAPYKGTLEMWYLGQQTLGLDIKIIFLTAWLLLFPESNLYRLLLRGMPKPPEGLKLRD